MTYAKTLGSAVAALLALMAFATSIASATTVENGTPSYGHPITWDAALAGTTELKTTSGSVISTCTGGTLKFIETQTGSATTTTTWHFLSSGVTWSGCTSTNDSTAGGEIEIHHIAGTSNGTLTGSGFEVTVNAFGASCTYGFGGSLVDFGAITGHSHTPVIHVNSVFTERTEDRFVCPNDVVWNATYHIVDPIGLTVTAG